MTNIIPRIDATTLGTVILRPLPDVEPFSIRSGYSFESILSDIRHWLTDELVPYLEDSSAQAIFQENVDTMIDTVNLALADQAEIVVDALNAAVQQVITADIPIADPIVAAILALNTSATRAYLDGRYVFTAPAPSGGDDTAVIQALVTAAQSTNGEVRFRAGHYRFNVKTAQSFVQPRLVGKGKQFTFFEPFDSSKPALKMQGGSGSNSGGYLSDLYFGGTGICGLELADVCDVHWDRIHFGGSLQVGLLFHVTQAQGFTEFCNGDASFDSSLALQIEYRTENSAQTSFHGSGLTDGIVNFAGAAAVKIGLYAFPYNAPMSATFFAHAPNTFIFDNQWAGSKPWFFGTLRVENQSNGVLVLAKSADVNTQVLFVGELAVNTAQTFLGKLYAASKVYATASRTYVTYEAWQRYLGIVAGSNYVDLFLTNGGAALVNVNVTGPNYFATYQMIVYQNPFTSSGYVSVIAGGTLNNGSGIGEMVFTIENYQLKMKNDSLSTAYNAEFSIMHFGGDVASDTLRQ